MRCVIPALFLFAAAVAVMVSGCDNPASTGKHTGGSTPVPEVLVLEYEEIDLIPGGEKEVKVRTGKADTAEAEKESGVTAKTDGGTVTVTADKDAKEGTHEVKVKGGKAKDATLKVHVKKKDTSK
jgi:hypothetical protein